MVAPMIKTIIVLLNFAFECRLVNDTHMIALMQAGKQANQLTSLKRDVLFNFCVCHKKGASGKHPTHENNTCLCFH